MPEVRVHVLPEMVDAAALGGRLCVVVDVLRATTTMAAALARGARAIVPCLSVEEARRRAAGFPPGEVLLAGERGGLPIEGFDLGNSPAEFTPQVVAGKTIVLTTTNGTRAILHCRAAAEIAAGALVNLSALTAYLATSALAAQTGVDVVCAGTESHVTREDVLLAGALAARLAAESWRLDLAASSARDAWSAVCGSASAGELAARVAVALGESRGGGNLLRIGMVDDIARAAAIDAHPVVPRFDPAAGAFRLAGRDAGIRAT